jgi:ribose 5-phosphate isomerase B
MKIAISADHGGVQLKNEIVQLLEELGLEYEDFGCDGSCSVDYPDYALPVAEKVANGEFDRGILICGTGIGMSIAANKVKGIRCALCHDVFSAKATREHNDSNVLAMGERVIGPGLAREIAHAWLTTEFSDGRHKRRVEKITQYESR